MVFRQASSVTPHSWLSHGPLSLLDEPTVAALVDTGVTGRWHRLRMPALRVRDFRLLLVSQFARGISYWMQFVTVPLLVIALGGGGLELGFAAMLLTGPILIFAPIGGVLADRLPRRPLLIAAQLILTVQALALLVLALLASPASLPWVFTLALVFGLVAAVEFPVRLSIMSDLVPSPTLPNAIALHAIGFNATRMAGPALAGILVAAAGPPLAFAVGALGSGIALLMMALIRPISVHTDEAFAAPLAALADGVRYVFAHSSLLWPLSAVAAVSVLGLAFQAILPLHALGVLGVGEAGYGFLLGMLGTGAVAALVVFGALDPAHSIAHIIIGLAACGVLLAVFAMLSDPLVAAIVLSGVGFAAILGAASAQLVIQSLVHDRYRGRVLGMYVALFNGGAAVGGMAAGSLVDVVGTRGVLLSSGIALGLLMLLLGPRLRAAELRTAES